MCCAAALASIDLVVKENLVENAAKMGAILQERLRAMQKRFPQIGTVQGKGLVAGVACVQPGTKNPGWRAGFRRGGAFHRKGAC